MRQLELLPYDPALPVVDVVGSPLCRKERGSRQVVEDDRPRPVRNDGHAVTRVRLGSRGPDLPASIPHVGQQSPSALREPPMRKAKWFTRLFGSSDSEEEAEANAVSVLPALEKHEKIDVLKLVYTEEAEFLRFETTTAQRLVTHFGAIQLALAPGR